jgi:hypothetical protein
LLRFARNDGQDPYINEAFFRDGKDRGNSPLAANVFTLFLA